MMSDYEAKDTFQRIVAQIVKRLVREGEADALRPAEGVPSGGKGTSQDQSVSNCTTAQRHRS
jgi:hypothetical protein